MSPAAAADWCFSDQLEHQEVGVLHIPSPHEPFPLERLWPPQLRSLRLVVTVQRLDPRRVPVGVPKRCLRASLAYRARLELIRLADRVLAPSRATVSDVQRRLGVNGRRIVLTPEGVSDDFKPCDSAIALSALREEFPAGPRRLRPPIREGSILGRTSVVYSPRTPGSAAIFGRTTNW